MVQHERNKADNVLLRAHLGIAYTSLAALIFCIILLLTNGFAVFTKGGWDPASFVTAYL